MSSVDFQVKKLSVEKVRNTLEKMHILILKALLFFLAVIEHLKIGFKASLRPYNMILTGHSESLI